MRFTGCVQTIDVLLCCCMHSCCCVFRLLIEEIIIKPKNASLKQIALFIALISRIQYCELFFLLIVLEKKIIYPVNAVEQSKRHTGYE